MKTLPLHTKSVKPMVRWPKPEELESSTYFYPIGFSAMTKKKKKQNKKTLSFLAALLTKRSID